ncbi:MAG TPA: riboflavin biosynthesis protein RibF [Bacteroidales bacterium]|nr:riboflavin biosynthesis protein RibF [Bacteroidales bacterium]
MAYAATIGFFDGMHLGHRFLLQELLSLSLQRHLVPMVVTFRQHPRSVLQSGYTPQLLMTPCERLEAIRAQGIENVQMLSFSDVRDWTKRRFMCYLHCELGVEVLLMGYNHHFGCDGNTAFSDYLCAAREEHLQLVQSRPYAASQVVVSSTKIRSLLLSHHVEQANALLAAPYSLTGRVVHGRQIGRRIGFPTANIEPSDSCKLIPASGVYAVEVEMDNHGYKGILNIGTNPTVGGTNRSLEVYIHGFSGNLYDQVLTIRFLRFLREEQRFSSLDELRKQITADCEQAFPQNHRHSVEEDSSLLRSCR